MRILVTVFLSVITIFISVAIADDTSNTITIGEKNTVFSKVLNEEREYWVSLPEGYDSKQKYPVVYLVDGEYNFEYTAGILRNLSGLQAKIPKMILVAIPNTNRTRDLTPTRLTVFFNGKKTDDYPDSGGAKKFLIFLTTELAPHIEAQYMTQPYRMFIGHSDGGMFGLYANLEEPAFFTSLIIMDPSVWWDSQAMVKMLKNRLSRPPTNHVTLYMSAANNPDSEGYPEGFVINPQREYSSLLSTWSSDSFRHTLEYFEKENHFSVPLPSLINGFEFIFDNYMFNFEKAYNNPSYLVDHYAIQSEKLGYRVKADISLIFMLANILESEDELHRAIEAVKLGVELYPDNKSLKEYLTKLSNSEK